MKLIDMLNNIGDEEKCNPEEEDFFHRVFTIPENILKELSFQTANQEDLNVFKHLSLDKKKHLSTEERSPVAHLNIAKGTPAFKLESIKDKIKGRKNSKQTVN